MTLHIRTFHKKRVGVQAINWDGDHDGAVDIVDWITGNGVKANFTTTPYGKITEHIAIETLEGTMRALPGDWIIRGVKGEFYPCKPEIFDATYEE